MTDKTVLNNGLSHNECVCPAGKMQRCDSIDCKEPCFKCGGSLN